MTYDSWKTTPPDDGFEPEPEDDGRDAFIAALSDKIKTWPDHTAPFACWCATVGDYDLDAKVGQGKTEGEAISDLLWQLGFEGGGDEG